VLFGKQATWYDKGKRLDGAMIGWIRRGTYTAARDEVRELWKVICLDLMPMVVPFYKKEIQLSTCLSEVVSDNQEVLVLWLLQECYGTWALQWKKDAEYTVQHGAKPPRRSKPRGQRNFAAAKAKEYLELLATVTEARKNDDTGQGWETPVIEAAREKHLTGDDRSEQGGNCKTNRAAKRAKLIFPVVGI